MFGPDLFHMRNTDRYDIFFRPIDYINRIKRGGAVWHLQILKSIKIQSLFVSTGRHASNLYRYYGLPKISTLYK